MKTRWRRIFYVVMIVNLIVGLVLTIVYTVRAASFTTFLSNFMSTIAQTAFWAFLIEHCGNVEKGIDSANRRAEGLPQLPDSAYSGTPDFIRNMFSGQQNTASQPAQPARPAQPAQPAQPVQPVQPVPQPTVSANDTWTCSCGSVNAGTANFCKSCGKPKG